MLHRITLFPASDYAVRETDRKKRFHDKEVSPQSGAPYGMMRGNFWPPRWGCLATRRPGAFSLPHPALSTSGAKELQIFSGGYRSARPR